MCRAVLYREQPLSIRRHKLSRKRTRRTQLCVLSYSSLFVRRSTLPKKGYIVSWRRLLAEPLSRGTSSRRTGRCGMDSSPEHIRGPHTAMPRTAHVFIACRDRFRLGIPPKAALPFSLSPHARVTPASSALLLPGRRLIGQDDEDAARSSRGNFPKTVRR